MFSLVVRFDLRDEQAAAGFDQLVSETAPGIRESEPGTLSYVVSGVEGAPLSRVFYELYRDKAAFEAHEAAPHTRRFLAERDLYVSETRVEFLTDPHGKGI
ncbi:MULTISPECIES: putative quinol monooxygenase [Actinoalloteichus]|uniref:ABM domain-containing protein n=1 Tax=Actinoalloteichus fjordicus TaxID=1612552 RepID=A0AAC9PVD2_9PSEU|nr:MULTISPECIES: antibiotic biosynthesis monooxygenase [Actinoalloteichus]APU17945.1 hypothetical protein UA74_29765 [Actinoalloteichus fjordicus]APU24024.1 hypothetical protein UA75_30300 [Actinoalloteichus sp. GBA129-24]